MANKIRFDKEKITSDEYSNDMFIHKENGEIVTIDSKDIFDFDIFVEYLKENQNEDVAQYWQLCKQKDLSKGEYEKYQIKGNLETAILKALDLKNNEGELEWKNYWEDHIENVKYSLMGDFDRQKSVKHTYGNLQKVLIKFFMKSATSKTSDMWLKKVKKTIFL